MRLRRDAHRGGSPVLPQVVVLATGVQQMRGQEADCLAERAGVGEQLDGLAGAGLQREATRLLGQLPVRVHVHIKKFDI